jgi:hypothetical protein
MIVLLLASSAVIFTVVVEPAEPPTHAPSDIEIELITPSNVTLTVLVPATIVFVAVPEESTDPAPAWPEYNEIANESCPNGAVTLNVHVSGVLVVGFGQAVDPAVVLKYADVPPFTETPIDCVPADTYAGTRRDETAGERCGIAMLNRTAVCDPETGAAARGGAKLPELDGAEPAPLLHPASAAHAMAAKRIFITSDASGFGQRLWLRRR